MSRFEAISAPSAPLEEDEAPTRCPAPPQAKAARPASNLDGSDLEKQPTVDTRRPTLEPTISHVSTHDIAHVPTAHTGGPPVSDEVYDRFTLTRKNIITAVLSFCGFLAPISSTTILAAIPEVAETLLRRHSASTEPGLLLRFPHHDGHPRHVLPDHRLRLYWRHLQTGRQFAQITPPPSQQPSYSTSTLTHTSISYPDRARHRPRLVLIRHARRTRIRPLHRRHHRDVPVVARHLLATDGAWRLRLHADPATAARDDALQAERRAGWAVSQGQGRQDVAVDESLPRAQVVPLSQLNHRRKS
ncbi:hypothetical protein MPH_11652 [Macrophomina phaseolina MS6]|uniref:Uncharacterized protein n=1 Tax=Macrophomina phaseolina (strain MS6) TaxID=1126212 RepID=K2QMS2_MACPH|nr:hypothetical protein MPH_11652 [Macrophomina phaseolina MS6]